MKNQQFCQQLPHEVTHRLMSKALNTLSITDCIILSLLTVTHLPFSLIPPSLRLCHHGLISSSRPPLSYGLSAHTFNVMIFSSQWFSITKRWPDLFAKAFFPNLSRYEQRVVARIGLVALVSGDDRMWTVYKVFGQTAPRCAKGGVWTSYRSLVLWVNLSQKGRLTFFAGL